MFKSLNKEQRVVFLIILLLIPFALFYRLGESPLMKESPRRALIALEMIYNQNYVAHTELGKFYLKKPPMFNWLIAGLFNLNGGPSDFWARFVSAFSLLGMSFSLFILAVRITSRRIAFFSALLLLVTSQLLFSYANTAEMDIFYSWVTFSSLVVLLLNIDKLPWLGFLCFYLLNAIGFLTKGFPTIAFIGVTLVVITLFRKDWWLLFKLPNIIGFLVFLTPLLFYFYAYSEYNDPLKLLGVVWDRSSKRTVLQNDSLSLVRNLLFFPLENLLMLLPGSLLFLCFLKKENRLSIKKNKTLYLITFIVLANLFVYWVSPGSRPRYVFMFYPALVLVGTAAFLYTYQNKSLMNRVLKNVVLCVSAVMSLLLLSVPLIEDQLFLIPKAVSFSIITCWALAIPLLLTVFWTLKHKVSWLALTILMMLVARTAYNEIHTEITSTKSEPLEEKQYARQVANMTDGQRVHYYHWMADGDFTFMYYLSVFKGEVLAYDKSRKLNDFYILQKKQIDSKTPPFQKIMDIRFQRLDYILVQFSPEGKL